MDSGKVPSTRTNLQTISTSHQSTARPVRRIAVWHHRKQIGRALAIETYKALRLLNGALALGCDVLTGCVFDIISDPTGVACWPLACHTIQPLH